MAGEAIAAANHLLERARRDGRDVTIMWLLKLAYIAHGWSLALLDRPLFDDKIEAWPYGPVIPEVYFAFRPQGVTLSAPVPAAAELDAEARSILDQTYDIYGDMSASKLSKLTHVAQGPWHIAQQAGGDFARIPDDLVRMHYADKLSQATEADRLEPQDT